LGFFIVHTVLDVRFCRAIPTGQVDDYSLLQCWQANTSIGPAKFGMKMAANRSTNGRARTPTRTPTSKIPGVSAAERRRTESGCDLREPDTRKRVRTLLI
jgi:hypothetical protein